MPRIVFWNIARAGGAVTEANDSLVQDLDGLATLDPELIVLCECNKGLRGSLAPKNGGGARLPHGYQMIRNYDKTDASYHDPNTLRYAVIAQNALGCAVKMVHSTDVNTVRNDMADFARRQQEEKDELNKRIRRNETLAKSPTVKIQKAALGRLVKLRADLGVVERRHGPNINWYRPMLHITFNGHCVGVLHAISKTANVYLQMQQIRYLYNQCVTLGIAAPEVLFGDMNMNMGETAKRNGVVGSLAHHGTLNTYAPAYTAQPTHRKGGTLDWALADGNLGVTVRLARSAIEQARGRSTKKRKIDDDLDDYLPSYDNAKASDHDPILIAW